MIEIVEANTDELIAQAKELFQEYAESLGFDLCFQNFNAEMDSFPKQYSPPTGCLFLALSETQPIGCVGLRYFKKGICEMKRLYVRPAFRGRGLGKDLANAVIRAAREIGYAVMKLDTLPSMSAAIGLYECFGFVETDAYRYNPIEGTKYMELDLAKQ